MGSDPERLGVTGLESIQWVIGGSWVASRWGHRQGVALVGHKVVLRVVPLRGFAHGLTLSSLRRVGVRPMKSVLLEQRTASYGGGWSREVEKNTEEQRHRYRPLAEEAVEGVLSLLKAGCWEFKRLT